tara:strand:+ start:182 stop:301 length:120 start_codon:yes stop_codon:yes gene_type:complete
VDKVLKDLLVLMLIKVLRELEVFKDFKVFLVIKEPVVKQ